jgi:hypothetical protein
MIKSLRSSEISIHRAWTLRKLPIAEQQSALGYQRFKKHRGERLRKLLANHIPKCDPVADSLRYLNMGLTGLKNTPYLTTHWKLFDELITALEREFLIGRSDYDVRQSDHQADPGRQ